MLSTDSVCTDSLTRTLRCLGGYEYGESNLNLILYGGGPLSTFAKFSEKLTFPSSWYAHVRVRIRGSQMLVFRKMLRTYLMDGPILNNILVLWRTYTRLTHISGWNVFNFIRSIVSWMKIRNNVAISRIIKMASIVFEGKSK